MAKHEYMGLSEIAELLGVSKQLISNWRARGKLPEPLAILRMGPIWRSKDIKKHFKIKPTSPETK